MSRTPYEDEELLRSLEEYVTESGRRVSRMVFWCRLTTLDGAVRTIQWQGEPPRTIEVPLGPDTVSFMPLKEMPLESRVATRRYEYNGRSGVRTWEYRECH